MPHRPKVLLVALDAAEPSLVEPWLAEGRLPHLQRLAEEGRFSRLRSPAEEFPDEVWPAIYTSSNAARLGKYFYIQPKKNTHSLELVDDAPKGTPFWLTASDYGRRCAVIDVPKIALGDYICGIQIANWGAHATRCEPASHPPELFARVLEEYGPYPLDSCDNHGRSAREYRRLRDQLLAGARLRGRLFEDLMAQEPWDLFFCAFSETHCVGHQFWHWLDPAHPQHRGNDPHGLRNAVRDVYQAVDEQLGRLLAAAGPEAAVLVFSGHGMAPQYHGRDLLPALIEMWGLPEPRNRRPDPARERRVTVRRGLTPWLKETVPMRWQYAVKRRLPQKIERAIICRVMGNAELDPEARAWYVPNNDINPAFRVNLKGRDPHGLVDPGSDYEELCEFLAARLRELINPATGRPAIRKLTRPRDFYQGPYLDRLPDLTAMWSQEAPIHELYSPGYGTVSGRHRDLRTGGHDSAGFLVWRDPAGRALHTAGSTARDVAPTVLSLLDVPAPKSMQGRSLLETKAGAVTR